MADENNADGPGSREPWLEWGQVLKQFEDTWRQGRRPDIDAYLPPNGEARVSLRMELIHLELECRLKAGEPARVEEYLRRYPDLADETANVLDLLRAEFELRRRAQPDLSLAEYADRFPHFRQQLEAELLTPPITTPGRGPAAAAAPRAGMRLGKYDLLEEVGRGGFGVVFRARDAELNRTVAVKVPRSGQLLASDEQERALREARSAAALHHPLIVTLHEVGRHDGVLFLVSEFVQGTTLAARIKAGRPDFAASAELLAQLADALAYAHAQGVIHRDVKPGNVLLDEAGRPHVLDFGLAKRETGEATMTQEGELLGTPAYMSPEQARGDAHGVDARTDLYSLGVILYELLTGEAPFRGNARMVLKQVLEDEPRPPRNLNDEVPRDLETICLKCLQKEPARRYATAQELADDLRRWQRGEPIRARPAGALERGWRWCRRKPLAAAVLVLLILLAAGSTSAAVWIAQAHAQVKQEKEAVEAEKERANEEADLARAVHDFLRNDLLAQAAPDKYPRNKQVTVEEVLGRAASRIAGKFDRQPRVEAAIRQTIGDTYRELGNYPAAQPHLERALEIRRVLSEEHPDRLLAMNNLAMLYRLQRQYAKAEPLLVATLEIRRRVLGEEDFLTLNSMNNLALLYVDQRQYAEAEPLYVKALEVCRRVLGEEHSLTLTVMSNLAALYHVQGQYAKAEPLLFTTLEVRRRVLGEEHPETLISLNNLAEQYRLQGQYAKAEPLFVTSLEAHRRVLGEESPRTLDSVSNLALLYRDQGQHAKAEPLFVEALEVRRRVLGEEHSSTLIVMNNLADVYRLQGRYSEAEPLYVKTLEVRRRVLGEEHLSTFHSIYNLAELYRLQGQHPQAEPLYREGLTKIRKRHGEASPPAATALANLGLNLLQQKKYADAEPLLRESLAIREVKEPDAWTTFNTRSQLGNALLGQGNYADAEPLLLQGYAGLKQRAAKIPKQGLVRLTEALERLVQLYDAWGKPDEAVKWRKELDDWKKAEERPRSKK